jgi:hypothetical protein
MCYREDNDLTRTDFTLPQNHITGGSDFLDIMETTDEFYSHCQTWQGMDIKSLLCTEDTYSQGFQSLNLYDSAIAQRLCIKQDDGDD